jgi:hypothetical protein
MESRLIMEVTTIKQPKISPLIKTMPQTANIQTNLINKDPKGISLKAITPQAPQATTPPAAAATATLLAP